MIVRWQRLLSALVALLVVFACSGCGGDGLTDAEKAAVQGLVHDAELADEAGSVLSDRLEKQGQRVVAILDTKPDAEYAGERLAEVAERVAQQISDAVPATAAALAPADEALQAAAMRAVAEKAKSERIGARKISPPVARRPYGFKLFNATDNDAIAIQDAIRDAFDQPAAVGRLRDLAQDIRKRFAASGKPSRAAEALARLADRAAVTAESGDPHALALLARESFRRRQDLATEGLGKRAP